MNREKDTAALREGELDTALRALVTKLDLIDKPVGDLLTFAMAHGYYYEGPNYEAELAAAKAALTVNTSTHGNDLEYNGLAASRDLEKRVLALEFEVSLLKGGKE